MEKIVTHLFSGSVFFQPFHRAQVLPKASSVSLKRKNRGRYDGCLVVDLILIVCYFQRTQPTTVKVTLLDSEKYKPVV